MEFIARLLLMAMFLYASTTNFFKSQSMKELMEAKNIPYSDVLFPLSMLGMLLASVAIVFNAMVILSALYLMIFMGVATFYFADFWNAEGKEKDQLLNQFTANLTIIGGLFLLIIHVGSQKI